jgi:peptidyl-prolyl cis-trans isomerase C
VDSRGEGLIRAKGSQVPLKPGAKELTEEEALAKANDLRKRILAGEDFAALAKAESDDAKTAVEGGSLGAFPRGRMVPSFDEAAFKLKPGELSEPVKSPYGYHIIKVEAHTTKTFDEVRAQILAMPMLIQAKVQKTLEDMTKDAFYDPEFFAAPKPPVPGLPTAARPGAPPTLSVQPVPAKPAVPAAPAAAPQK